MLKEPIVYTDKQLLDSARVVLVLAKYDMKALDPTELTITHHQTHEWFMFCLESTCIAQQLYMDKNEHHYLS